MNIHPTFEPTVPNLSAEEWAKWQAQSKTWLRELLMIDTTNPPGNEVEAADWLVKILDQYGVAYDRIEAAPGRSNVIARLEGHGAGKGNEPMLLTAHMDVVPHVKEFWTQDPFGGAIVDDWLYGRGAVDMKYMLVENLVTFLVLKQQKLQLNRDVIFLALSDEEAGCEFGSRYLVEHHPKLIEARWGMNELGGFPVYIQGKHKMYLVQVAEKGLVWCRIRIPGSPGHGSLVQDDNPVSKAAAVIAQLQQGVHAFEVTESARSFVHGIAGQMGALGAVLRMMLLPSMYPLVRKVISDPEQRNVFRAILHDTANPTMMQAGAKVNVVPSEAYIEVDGRTLPGHSTEDFLRPIRAILPEGSDIEIISEGPPYSVPAAGPLYETIGQTLNQADPGVPVVPYLMSGFSDSKWLGKLGAEIYGFAPVHFPPDVSLTKLVHGHDERIPLAGYHWGQAVHTHAVAKFTASE